MKSDKREPTYYDLLRRPEWQEMRLRIMEMAGFVCEQCGEKKTLNVHHSFYEKGRKPWEYPIESLHCLCEDCHTKAQDLKAMLNRKLGQLSISADMEELYGFACGLEAQSFPNTTIEVPNYEIASGVAAAWEIDTYELIDALVERQIDGWKLDELRSESRRRKANARQA